MKLLRFSLSLGLALLTSFGVQSAAFAEDYYVPIKKELEPMARLPLPAFKLENNKVTYTLPRDITGRPIHIDATLQDHGDNAIPRIFKGPLATLACMGDNVLPACVVTHTKFGIDRNEVTSFLSQKYKDPKKLQDAISVADQFASGSDPIGIISKRTLLAPKAIPMVWKVNLTRITEDKSVVNGMVAKFDLNEGKFDQMATPGRSAKTKEVFQDEGHWSGILEFDDKEVRWFDMSVSTDKKVLTGTWGFFADGKPMGAQGAFIGEPLQ